MGKKGKEEEYLIVNVMDMGKAIGRKSWIVAFFTLLCGIAGFIAAAFVMTPQYRASALMYVNNSTMSVGNTSIDLSDLTASQNLVDTYIIILKSRRTMEEVIKEADLKDSYDDVVKRVEAERVGQTQVFEIAYLSDEPEEAQRVVNTIAEVLPKKIAEIIEGSSARAVDFAVKPTKRDSPNAVKFTLAGMAAGLFFSCFLILLSEFLNRQIQDEDYLNRTYDFPILTAVPDLVSHRRGSYQKQAGTQEKFSDALSFEAIEAYKLLRVNLQFALPDVKTGRVIGICSAMKGEGKSTTAYHIANVLAEEGNVLLIEADMRLPVMTQRTGIQASHGLSEFLAGLCPIQKVLKSGGRENLTILPAGSIPPNPSELLGTKRMRDMLQAVSERYDHVILDLPPVTEVSDALVVAPFIDGMLMVVRRGYSSCAALEDAISKLRYANAKILGFVMTFAENGRSKYKKTKYYRDYGYYTREEVDKCD